MDAGLDRCNLDRVGKRCAQRSNTGKSQRFAGASGVHGDPHAFLAFYMWWLHNRRPLLSLRSALQIGTVWAVLTVGFEFGLGLGVAGDSFSELIHNYNFPAGRVWALVPICMFGAQYVFTRLAGRSSEGELS